MESNNKKMNSLGFVRPTRYHKAYMDVDADTSTIEERNDFTTFRPVVLLLGHSFVRRYTQHSFNRGQSLAEAAGLAGICHLHAFSSSGGTFARFLSDPGVLLNRLSAFPQLPDILVIDLGTNDLCPVVATVNQVVGEAMALLEVLRGAHLLPQHVVFLSVVQRTASGCHRGVAVQTFNHRVKAFNSRLAAAVQPLEGIHMFSQSRVNLPRYISKDGCHLSEKGMERYGQGLRKAILRYRRCV